jgi:homospermidine synthase
MAILMVNRKEKATSVKLSRELRGVSLREPNPKRKKQPKEVEEVWSVVKSQGSRACGFVSNRIVRGCRKRTLPSTALFESVNARLRTKYAARKSNFDRYDTWCSVGGAPGF